MLPVSLVAFADRLVALDEGERGQSDGDGQTPSKNSALGTDRTLSGTAGGASF